MYGYSYLVETKTLISPELDNNNIVNLILEAINAEQRPISKFTS